MIRCKQCGLWPARAAGGLCVHCRPVKPCRHCRQRPRACARGLCAPCYGNLEVRQKYPTSGRHVSGYWIGSRRAPLPATPTTALPGTPEKVAVLCERARTRVQLFHPDDARGSSVPAGELALPDLAAAVLDVVPAGALVPYREIAAELGTRVPPRSSLRQVLRQLLSEGRLVRERGRWTGYRVLAPVEADGIPALA